jgi:hypothetical protein
MIQPYIKGLSLNCSYDNTCRYILDVAQKVKSYTLVSESKTLNKYVYGYYRALLLTEK